MREIDEHSAGIGALADDVLLDMGEQLMHLHLENQRLGLTFAVTGGLFEQFSQIFAANTIGQLSNSFFEIAVFYQQLEMHLRLAAQTVNRFQKGLTVGSYRTPQCLIRVEDGTKSERKDGQGTKALAYDTSMIDNCLLGEGLSCGIVADDDCEIAAGAGQYP